SSERTASATNLTNNDAITGPGSLSRGYSFAPQHPDPTGGQRRYVGMPRLILVLLLLVVTADSADARRRHHRHQYYDYYPQDSVSQDPASCRQPGSCSHPIPTGTASASCRRTAPPGSPPMPAPPRRKRWPIT